MSGTVRYGCLETAAKGEVVRWVSDLDLCAEWLQWKWMSMPSELRFVT